MSLTGTLSDLHAMVTALHPAAPVALTVLAVSVETSLFVGLLIPGGLVLLVAGTTVTSPGGFVAVAGSQLARVNGSLGLLGYGVLLVVGVLIALKCGKAVKTTLRGGRSGGRVRAREVT
jgi:membrane-associated protein